MKILIASRACIKRMRVHKLLQDTSYDWHFIFDDDVQRERAIKEAGIPRKRCHIAGISRDICGQAGVANIREWGERNLININEWYAWMDDNVSHFTWLPNPWYNLERIDFDEDWDLDVDKIKLHNYEFRSLYETICPIETVEKIFHETIAKCEEYKTVYAGFAIETNFFFRRVKWQYHGFGKTQTALVKNTGLPWMYWKGNMLEDFTRSVDVVARYGTVIVNRFMKQSKPFFEEGGIGSFKERLPNMIETCKKIMDTWPGLLRYVKNTNYQLTFRFRSQKSIDTWRREHKYI